MLLPQEIVEADLGGSIFTLLALQERGLCMGKLYDLNYDLQLLY